MSSIVLQSRSGPDSKLHLEVPVGQPDTEFEVEVVVRRKSVAFVSSRLLRPDRVRGRRDVDRLSATAAAAACGD